MSPRVCPSPRSGGLARHPRIRQSATNILLKALQILLEILQRDCKISSSPPRTGQRAWAARSSRPPSSTSSSAGPPGNPKLSPSPSSRTHGGREVDFVLHAPDRVLVLEGTASHQAHRLDARPLAEVLPTLAVRGVPRDAWRLGVVVTRGREVEPLAPGVWAVPDWRLFGPAG